MCKNTIGLVELAADTATTASTPDCWWLYPRLVGQVAAFAGATHPPPGGLVISQMKGCGLASLASFQTE
jgi:hypothetical protein